MPLLIDSNSAERQLKQQLKQQLTSERDCARKDECEGGERGATSSSDEVFVGMMALPYESLC